MQNIRYSGAVLPAVALLSLTGCLFGGSGSIREPVPPELTVYRPPAPALSDRHTSGHLKDIPAGAWVKYRFIRESVETVRTYAVVAVETDSVWIEVVEEGPIRKASQRRITFTGEVRQAVYQEFPAGKGSSIIVEQPLTTGSEDPIPAEPVEVKTESKPLKFGERTIDVREVRSLYRDEALGREYDVVEGSSPAIPAIFETREGSGLVRRKSPAESVELLDFGTGYSSLIRS